MSKFTTIQVLSAVAGFLVDIQKWRKTVSEAKAANQPTPDFDFISTMIHVTIALGIGTAGAVATNS